MTVVLQEGFITTTDGDEYFQSGIENDTGYADVITQRRREDRKVMSFYTDLFGHVRASS